MISAMTLGQAIAAQNIRPPKKGRTRRRIDLRDFRDIILKPEVVPPTPVKPKEPKKQQSGRPAWVRRRAQGLCWKCKRTVAVTNGKQRKLCEMHLEEDRMRYWEGRH